MLRDYVLSCELYELSSYESPNKKTGRRAGGGKAVSGNIQHNGHLRGVPQQAHFFEFWAKMQIIVKNRLYYLFDFRNV